MCMVKLGCAVIARGKARTGDGEVRHVSTLNSEAAAVEVKARVKGLGQLR